jgi:hypothetical protein
VCYSAKAVNEFEVELRQALLSTPKFPGVDSATGCVLYRMCSV